MRCIVATSCPMLRMASELQCVVCYVIWICERSARECMWTECSWNAQHHTRATVTLRLSPQELLWFVLSLNHFDVSCHNSSLSSPIQNEL